MNVLNRMKLWQKLILMVAVLMVPTVYLVTLLIKEKNISIDLTRNEISGVEYLKPVYSLLTDVIDHRGMHHLALSGDTSIRSQLQDKEQEIKTDLAQIAEMENRNGSNLKTGEHWQAIKNGWESLQDQLQGLSKEESLARHTTLINNIIALITRVNDTSGLLLDPEPDSSNLIDLLVIKVPPIIESLDSLRSNSAAGLLSTQTDASKFELAIFISSIRDQVNAIQRNLKVAYEFNPDLESRLTGVYGEFENNIKKFTQAVDGQIGYSDSSTGNVVNSNISAQDMFRIGSTAIASAIRLNEQTIPTISQLLKSRIDSLSNKKDIALFEVVISIFISFIIAFYITRYISQNVDGLVAVIKQFSKGNLTMELFENNDKDEISQLYNSLHDLQFKLADVISNIRLGTSEVGSASEQVAQGNANLSQRTQEQASSLEEVASSMEEMTGTVGQNADNAQQANQLALSAREQADAGGAVVSRAMSAMSEINDSSKKIADIIGVIDEIAFQTNLLALNAAVEAARAGEQGRGFAVVASEVRNLAGRSATAAKEIKALIQDSVNKTQDGTKLVDESGHALTEIVQAVKKVSDIVAEIAAASREQSEGINQVNKALLQMDDMTQQNAALVEEAAAAAEAIDAQSKELEHQVQFFKINESENSPKPRVLGHSVNQDKTLSDSGEKAPKVAYGGEKQEAKNVLPKLQTEDDSDWQEF